MFRTVILRLALACGLAMMVGCPTTPPGGGNIPPNDPQQPTQPTLSINSTGSILQAEGTQFRNSAQLSAVLGNADPETTTFEWSFTADGEAALGFGTNPDTATTTAEGRNVSVVVTRAPSRAEGNVSHTISVTATLADNRSLSATIRIIVQPNPLEGGESTILSLAPFATPPVGTEGGQVLLNAGITGEVGEVEFDWTFVGDQPAGIEIPANRNVEVLTINVADDVSGVFAFRVTATDVLGNAANAILNVYLGIVDLLLDVRPMRIQLNPSSAVEIQTVRAGGVADLDAGQPGEADNTFFYEWTILDDTGSEVDPGTYTLSPASGAFYDANVIDWEITGLDAGAYRFLVTVTDRQGTSVTSTSAIILTDELGATVTANLDRVPVGEDFRLRTVRTGGQPPFTYNWSVINQNTVTQTGSTTFAPSNGSQQAATTLDWVIGGFANAGVYQFFLTVTDGAGFTTAASTSIAVGDVLTLDVRAAENIVQPSAATNLRLMANGGIPPYDFTLTSVPGSGSGTPVLGATAVNNDADGVVDVSWTAPAAAFQGSYRVDVTVTDDAGRRARDSVWLIVDAGGGTGLSLDVRASRLQIGTAAATYNGLLRTLRQNGVGPTFAYNWTVLNASGTNVTPNFDITTTSSLNDANIDWDVELPAPVPPGTYNFVVQVTDNATSDAFVGSQEILIANVLTADIRPFLSVLAEGMPMPLTSVASGGVPNYTHVLSAQDSSDFLAGDDSGIFSDAGNPSTLAGNTASETDTFYPDDGPGAYRISSTITDSVGNTAAATANVLVTDNPDIVIRYAITDAIPEQTTLNDDGVVTGGLIDLPDSGNSATIGVALPNARNLTIRVSDNGTGTPPTFTQILINGTNARGQTIQEGVDAADLADLNIIGQTAILNLPFATVTTVEFTYADGDNDDQFELGVGERFGLPGRLSTVSDSLARRGIQLIASAAGNTLATNPEQAVFDDPEPDELLEVHAGDEDPPGTPTADQQYFVFPAGLLDGDRDFFIQFAPLP